MLVYNFLIIIVISATSVNCFTQINYSKCCDSESVLQRNDSDINSYFCVKNQTTRIQIATNQLLNTTVEDLCIDSEDNRVFLFQYVDGKFLKTSMPDIEFTPKCCPLNYFYDSKLHSCVQSEYSYHPYFIGKILKIGLAKCDMIADFKLSRHIRIDDLVKDYKKGFYCFDREKDFDLSILRVCKSQYNICNNRRCVLKCCQDGQSFVNGPHCRDTYVHGINLTFSSHIEEPAAPFVIIHGFNPGLYRLTDRYSFTLHKNGLLSVLEKSENATKYYGVEEAQYCIEYFEKGPMKGYSFFRTFPKDLVPLKFVLTRYAMVISCIFLGLTLIYYLSSNHKNTIFGKALISYCIATLILFALVSFSAFDVTIGHKDCTIIKYFLLFSCEASFTWLNVMCIDIYWTFGSPKSFSSLRPSRKALRFILYSLYGWGFPLFITGVLFNFYYFDLFPPSYKIKTVKCSFHKENTEEYLVFAIPIALEHLFNTVLFIKTIIYCMKVKGEISKMNDTNALKGEKKRKFSQYKTRLGLLIKLAVIMGVSFLFEVFSIFVDFKRNPVMATIEIIWDTINSLQGLFIFCIFVLKKSTFNKLKKKFVVPKSFRRFSLVSSAMTQTTTVTTSNPMLDSTKKKFEPN